MALGGKLIQELRSIREKLDNEGKLPSKAELERYYQTFRQRFGPDKLRNLDGEALLETIQDHGNRNSLVYWLEFKDDEEFPAIFGSIAGGSALKFGIYRRKETGVWMAGSSQSQRELSLEEAILYARKHRDQFLKGAEVLERFPGHGANADYQDLQKSLDKLAPDVSRLAWGHKYFSLLYPDKLDVYHKPEYQRFHLIKLLQTPPAEDGLYVAAGRYVAIANELGMQMVHLMTVLNSRNGRPHRYWRIMAPDRQPAQKDGWEVMRDGSFIAITENKLGDLSEAIQNEHPRERISNAVKEHYPDPADTSRQVQEIFNFVSVISEGDVVLAVSGKKLLSVGRVSGGYTYEPSSVLPHRRSVQWLDLSEWSLPDPKEGELLTVLEGDKRGKTVLLPLSGTPFLAPGNVYIIGTMNTADRSIALLDTALRRRFGFIELMPDSSVLGNTVVKGIPLGPWLDELNRRICEHVGRDARNLQIGHSYLLERGRPVTDFARFSKIIREDLIPLLEEYCYEDYSTLEKILGPGLVDRERQQIKDELFEDSRQDELVQALLTPEVTASRQAMTFEAESAADTSQGSGDGEDEGAVPTREQ